METLSKRPNYTSTFHIKVFRGADHIEHYPSKQAGGVLMQPHLLIIHGNQTLEWTEWTHFKFHRLTFTTCSTVDGCLLESSDDDTD